MNKITRKKPNYNKIYLDSYVLKNHKFFKELGFKEVKKYGIKVLRKKV